jgi:hypothetical protein
MDRIQLQEAEMTNAGRQAADAADADLDAGDDAALIARSLHAPECFGVLFDRHAPAIGRYIAGGWAPMPRTTWWRRLSWPPSAGGTITT